MEDDPEWGTWLIYRRAYGMARDRIDRGRELRPGGVDPDRLLKRLKAEVLAELGETSGPTLAAIEWGIIDATEGRRPAW